MCLGLCAGVCCYREPQLVLLTLHFIKHMHACCRVFPHNPCLSRPLDLLTSDTKLAACSKAPTSFVSTLLSESSAGQLIEQGGLVRGNLIVWQSSEVRLVLSFTKTWLFFFSACSIRTTTGVFTLRSPVCALIALYQGLITVSLHESHFLPHNMESDPDTTLTGCWKVSES